MIIYVGASPSLLAYYVDGGPSGVQPAMLAQSAMEAEYMAILYALTDVVFKMDKEKMQPIEIRSDNKVVVEQLNRVYHLGNDRLRKLAIQIWNSTAKMDVKFSWVPQRENLAGEMLK